MYLMGFYSKKLIRRLQYEFGIKFPADIKIRPCRPGWATRSAGGFNWTFQSAEQPGLNDIGSQHTVRECAMAKTIRIYYTGFDAFIDVVEEQNNETN